MPNLAQERNPPIARDDDGTTAIIQPLHASLHLLDAGPMTVAWYAAPPYNQWRIRVLAIPTLDAIGITRTARRNQTANEQMVAR
jgi:hypothetical protein